MTDTAFAAGSVVVVRDEEWIVSSCERAGDGWKVRCVGSSELARDMPATFYSALDDIEALDPAEAELVRDDSPSFRRSRLWVEAVLRKTPVPLHELGLTVSQRMLLDPLDFQRQAVAQALDASRLRPRLLIADAVGLGKTLEIGMILSELARRGRAERVLVVSPRHVLEQMQYELWTRFGLPLVRLDSDGIQRVRQQLPASRNPFTFFPKVIVSIDTLKSARYRAHLEKHRWDAVVIDESHGLAIAAGMWSSLLTDFLRALRLNCLTADYAPLWEELFDPLWQRDYWTREIPSPPMGEVAQEWTMATPLRPRRRALPGARRDRCSGRRHARHHGRRTLRHLPHPVRCAPQVRAGDAARGQRPAGPQGGAEGRRAVGLADLGRYEPPFTGVDRERR